MSMEGVDLSDSDDGKLWILEESGYKVIKNNPIVYFYSRNFHNKLESTTHKFSGFRPYFYAPANESPKLPPGCEYNDEVELDCMNREVRKVYTDVPATVRRIKESGIFSFTDMADFLFEKRFSVDYGIYYAYKLVNNKPVQVDIEEILPPRVMVADIEVLAPPGPFPAPDKTLWPVVSIQTKDLYTREILVFTADNLVINNELIRFPQTHHEDHIACSSEQDLFKTFMAYLREINPDLLTFWNGAKFDYPYLIRRAHLMNYEINSLGRQGIPRCEYDNDNDDLYSTHIVGRSSLDMLKAYKIFYKQKAERESYDLKTVSADYGFEYTDYGFKLLELLKNKEYDTFIQYCRNDVIALENINNHTGLWNHYETLRKIAGCKLNNTLHNSVIIESAFLKYGMGPMPSKAPYNKDSEKFEGALVLLPPAGIHEWVGTVDLAALYPTVMRAFPDKCCPDPNYKVIEILEIFVSERERYRALNKTEKSTENTKLTEFIFKVLANSVYGALGLKSFRLFKRECAESVTSIGRDVDRFVHKKLREYGYSVCYSDTDSSFFSKIETVEEGIEVQDRLNKDLAAWCKETGARVNFTLKFEKLYRRILFKKDEKPKQFSRWEDIGAKKKYVGHIIWKEGEDYTNDRKLNYMGLELVRSDNSKFTKEMLYKFFEIVLIDGDIPAASNFIRKSYKDVKNGKIPIIDLSIPKQLRAANKKDSPHKRGIENTLRIFNYNIPDGVKPRLIYTKEYPYEFCIDEEIDLGDWINKIDWETTLEKNVTKKLRLYAESAGISWNHVIYGQQSILQFCKQKEFQLNPELLKIQENDKEDDEEVELEDCQ